MSSQPTEYAGFVTRAVAFVVDAAIVNGSAIIFAGAVALGVSVLPGSQELHGLGVFLAGTAFVLWCVAYWATFWTTTGQTPGSRVMHLRVQRLDGSTLHGVMAVVRVVATALAALPLLAGFIPIFLTRNRRGAHDWVAGTVVVHTHPELLAPPPHARQVGARRLEDQVRSGAFGRPLDDRADDAHDRPVVAADGLGGEQNGDRPADVRIDHGLGAPAGDEHARVELGDVPGERGS